VKLSDPALFRQACYINGEWVSGSVTIEVKNPADNTMIGTVPSLGKSEVQKALKHAKSAFEVWRETTAEKRSRILKKWFELICKNKEDLAYIITCEQGKPLSEAVIEIQSAAAYIEWFAEEAKRVYGDTIPMSQEDKRIIVLKEPVGLCAAITPWNFPSSMVTRKSAPALAAGCAIVVKPSELTPYSALALAELGDRAGLPPGVFNVVTGQAEEIVSELTTNADIRKVSFSGSTEVGKHIMRECSESLKKVSLELGGHAPFIVFEDADVDLAVADAISSKFRNSGQTCVCANRFFVQDGIYEEFVKKFIQGIKNQLIIGSGFVPGNNLGPLIDIKAIEKIEDQIKDATTNGAKIAIGGKRIGKRGFFFEPTVLLEVTPKMKIAQEETFGPIAPIFRFTTEAEALRLANDSEYGLSAYFYSRDISRAWRITESLEYGMVGVNTARLSSEAAPFGGMKKSGMGREGSKYGMDDYLEIKYMCIGNIRENSRH
jgi:succinate-semialdehyde dehydrogenase / glutarate-semialdehyde dehydrogenase